MLYREVLAFWHIRRNTEISVIIDSKKNLVLTFAGILFRIFYSEGEEMSIVGHAIFVPIDVMNFEEVHNRSGGHIMDIARGKLKESRIIRLNIVHGNMLEGCRVCHPWRGP